MTDPTFPETGTTARRKGFSGFRLQGGLLGVFTLACLTFFGWACWKGLWFLSFCDEGEHLLGGRMLNEGGRLYEIGRAHV